MADFDDLKLDKGPPPASPRPSRLLPAVIVVVLLCALAGGWYFLRRQADMDRTATVQRETVVPETTSLPQEAAAKDLPPLDESDDLVRELVSALSRHPVVAAWLTTDQLIRTFAVSLMNVANGKTPAGHLYTIKPERKFQTRQRGSRTYIDPQGYSRFDAHAAAVSSLDPQGTARLYTRLKPRIEEAYHELAGANADLDHAVQRAMAQLLATPIVEGEIAVEPRPVGFAYADASLESLSAAQRQLLRMGPQNVRLVQQQLRAIARQLGIDEASLPRERVIRTGG
jgi:hypothetical protein